MLSVRPGVRATVVLRVCAGSSGDTRGTMLVVVIILKTIVATVEG